MGLCECSGPLVSAGFHRLTGAAMLLGLLSVVALAVSGRALAVTGGDGVDRFGSCVAAQKVGQVLLMIDESGSLQQTDPTAARVTAAKYLVDQLTQFSADSGAAIDVAVAGFSGDYTQHLDWTRLDKSTLGGVESSIDGFRDRNHGADTDYWSALNGARTTLNDHKPENGHGTVCQALAWFTDGKIDYSIHAGAIKPYAPGQDLGSQSGVDATVRAAQESICRPGGVADQLRSSGIVTFGIGLAPNGSNSADFDLLKSIVTGEPTSTGKCGDLTAPSPGAFYLAQNIDDLLFAFDAFSTPGQPPAVTETGTCPGTQICEEAKHRFVLDRSVSSVSVLASADTGGLIPVVIPPTGGPQQLKPGAGGTLDFGGVSVAYQWLSDKSVSFRMTGSAAPSWQGVWALVFDDPSGKATAKTKSSVHISSDLYPGWPDRDRTPLRQDGTVPLTFTIVDAQQKPVDASSLLGKAELSAALIDAKGVDHQIVNALPKDQISRPQQLDLHGVNTGRATLRLSLAVTTADAVDAAGTPVAGTALAPRSVDLPVTIDPPVGYPSVSSSTIDFGKLEGAGSATGAVDIKGPGCVWLGGNDASKVIAAPDGMTDVKITSSAGGQSSCVKAADGAAAKVPVTIAVSQQGNGVINGTAAVMVAPTDASAPPLTVEVPFTLAVEKKLNTRDAVVTWVAAVLLGPGIPLLLLYLVKWFTSRIPAKALRAEQIAVRVSGASVSRNGQPFRVRDDELVRLVEGLTGPTRRLAVGAVELRARTGWSPFGAGYVVATSPGTAGAAGPSGATQGKVPYAKLPLAIQNSWFVLHDPRGPAEAATVVLLVGGDAGKPVIERLVREINESLPRILPELRTQATKSTGGDGGASSKPVKDNPFGSAGASTANGGGNPFRPAGAPTGRESAGGFEPSGRSPFGGGGVVDSDPPGRGPFGGPSGSGRPAAPGPFGGSTRGPGAPRPRDPGPSPFSPNSKPNSDPPPNPFRP